MVGVQAFGDVPKKCEQGLTPSHLSTDYVEAMSDRWLHHTPLPGWFSASLQAPKQDSTNQWLKPPKPWAKMNLFSFSLLFYLSAYQIVGFIMASSHTLYFCLIHFLPPLPSTMFPLHSNQFSFVSQLVLPSVFTCTPSPLYFPLPLICLSPPLIAPF